MRHGYEVVCGVRKGTTRRAPSGVELREGDVESAASIARDLFRGERFDAVVSCMASRTGVPRDAWAIDHRAHQLVLHAAREVGVPQMVLLSAICVQKPLLAFQQAKRAFEDELMASGLTWSIVRPTAFFKSLSGQVARVQQGKPFLLFGDGALTACKPISDRDLAEFIAGTIADTARHHRILPIGGPGPAMTPREHGDQLFALAGKTPRFKHVPVAILDAIIGVLGVAGSVIRPLAAKAELAKIGRYYATESMLVWDSAAQRYDAEATPSFGADTLAEHHARMLRGEEGDDRGAHKVF